MALASASSCLADPLRCVKKIPNAHLSPMSAGIHRARGTTEPSSATKAALGASRRGDTRLLPLGVSATSAYALPSPAFKDYFTQSYIIPIGNILGGISKLDRRLHVLFICLGRFTSAASGFPTRFSPMFTMRTRAKVR